MNLEEFGEFTGKLLESKINFSKKFEGKSLIQHAVDSDDILVVRFLKLFLDEIPEDILKMAVKQSRLEILAALLDLPIVDDGKLIHIDASFFDWIAPKTEETKNLLCIAAVHG